MSERMDERYGLDTPQEREREDMALRKKYQALEKERDQYRALMELACVDVIFFHSQEHGPFLQAEEPRLTEAIGFSVLVNDLFYPAADAEGFDISEAIPLRDVFRKDGMEGIIRWVQQKRDNLPLRPHVEKRVKEREDLRKENDRLRNNYVELECLFEKKEAENADLKQQVATHIHDLGHLQDVNNKLMDRVARLSAPVSHAGCRVVTAEGFASDPNYLEQSWPVTVEVDLRCHECRTTPAKEKQ